MTITLWPRKYILAGKVPVPCDDPGAWSLWYEHAVVRVRFTDVREGVYVSTVFLGLDHNFSGEGPPLLFETMVNRCGQWGEQERYATWDEAEAGHAAMVARVEKEEKHPACGAESPHHASRVVCDRPRGHEGYHQSTKPFWQW